MQVTCIEHRPELYNDDSPVPPPPVTQLPIFEGLPPEITDLNVTEFIRVDQTGARIATAWLSWTIDRLETGESPYDGAIIQRRRVASSAGAGSGRVGQMRIGVIILDEELEVFTDFETLAEVRDGARQYDDQKVFPGETYQYRVIPVSVRSVWSLTRAAYYVHHVTGTDQGDDGTRPETPQNLRLANLPVGTTDFEGPDIIFEVDPPKNDGAAKTTNLANEWQWEIWGTSGANNLAFRLYPGLNQPAVTTRQPRFEFTQAVNAEAAAAVNLDPQRKVTVRVWTRTQLQNQSIVPAQLTVNNVAPTMASIAPLATPTINGLALDWRSYIPPRDISTFRIQLDDQNPPREANALIDTQVSGVVRQFEATGLQPTEHAIRITPYDTFGAGIASPVVSATAIPRGDTFTIIDDITLTVTGPAEETILSLPVNVVNGVGAVLILGKTVISEQANSRTARIRIREDSVTGPILDFAIWETHWDNTIFASREIATLTALWVPDMTGQKTFHFTGEAGGAYTMDFTWSKMTIFYFVGDQ